MSAPPRRAPRDARRPGAHLRSAGGGGRLAVVLLGLLVTGGLGACGRTPTSAVVDLANAEGAPAPEAVRMQVFGATGIVHEETELSVSAPDAGARLGTVVVYPKGPDLALRVLARGVRGGAIVSTGTARLTLIPGAQVRADLVLHAGLGADRDGDGVPDEIDDCPTAPNPRQEAPDGGLCGAGEDGGPVAAGDARPGLDPEAGPAPKENGLPCAGDAECGSGICAEGLCCAARCEGLCRSCRVAGLEGTCALVPDGQDPRNQCAQQPVEGCGLDGTCDGAGACRRYRANTPCRPAACTETGLERVLAWICDGGGECVRPAGAPLSCAPYACAAGVCKTACAGPADCAPGQACTAGSCGPRPLGAACGAGAECASGHCVDGVCCDVAACAGPCASCNVGGAPGTCRPLPAGEAARGGGCAVDPMNPCGPTGRCDGSGGCQRPAAGSACGPRTCTDGVERAAPTCSAAGACGAGATRACEPYVCGPSGACLTVCANDAGCAAAFHCELGRCVPRRPLGSSCRNARDCASGHCVDGFCCESACQETCKTCGASTSRGRCVDVPEGGRDSAAAMPCTPPRSCDGRGTCR